MTDIEKNASNEDAYWALAITIRHSGREMTKVRSDTDAMRREISSARYPLPDDAVRPSTKAQRQVNEMPRGVDAA